VLLECLRCLARQTRIPEEIIIADASPDAAANREHLLRVWPGLDHLTRLTYLESPPGLTWQRNQILDRCTSDVIVFLDDDALAEPQYIERLMAVYEADTEGRVGGVEGLALEGEAAADAPAPDLEAERPAWMAGHDFDLQGFADAPRARPKPR